MKNPLLLALFFACSLQAVAQSANTSRENHTKKKTGLFVKLGIGYAFPQAGQTTDGSGMPYAGNVSYTNGGSTFSYNVKKVSFSAGLQGIAGVGYMFNKHIGAELDVALGIAPKKYTSTVDSLQVGNDWANESTRQYAKMPVYVIPAIIIQSGGEKINLYARAGIVLPVKRKVVSESQFNVLTTSDVVNETLETSASFSLGFSGALGVSHKINDNWKLWGEVSLLSLSSYVKQTDLTNLTVDGVNVTQMTGNLKQQYSKSSSNVTPANNEGILPTYSLPFSNVGINVGVAYCF